MAQDSWTGSDPLIGAPHPWCRNPGTRTRRVTLHDWRGKIQNFTRETGRRRGRERPDPIWIPERLTRRVTDKKEEEFPLAVLFRQPRDFGIIAIVTAIVASAAAAVTAGVAMASTVQTVQTINDVVKRTSDALFVQERINDHLASGVLLLNKRMDLLQAAMEDLFEVTSLGCVQRLHHMCVTPYPASLNESRKLGSYLSGNWSMEFGELQQNLTIMILQLNETRASVVTLKGFSDYILQGLQWFKEWVGVGLFGAVLLLGLLCTLFVLFRLVRSRKREKIALLQAMAAIEAGSSPAVWLSLFEEA
ncbi:endogenous retrovirus group K member 7 Env polyprotein-like [Lepus europaeus]|uniref:endogenous retrovirus group K member 7 Env polyprotein-like n=1 Tax=Lepus europaeus TaxID=9983 RepID=UPI002B464DE3|nr:endogenous retrovirus group K member 7 Env polyprotein-like [Lepus europaeus]